MEKDIFKSNQDLKRLYYIEKAIKNLYDKLLSLEIVSKKETKEYDYCKSNLFILLSIEKKVYEKISLTKASELLKIINSYNYISFEDYFYTIYSKDEDTIIMKRISYRLDMLINCAPIDEDKHNYEEFTDLEEIKEKIVEIEPDEFEDYEMDEDGDYEQDFEYYNNLETVIEKDLLDTILKIMNEYLNKSYYQNIWPDLIKYKYLIAFVFSDIEEELIKNNFDINDELYWGSKFVMDYYHRKQNTLVDVKNDYAMDLLFDQCYDLLDLMLEDINEGENYAYAISSQIIIRACLLFVDNNIVKSFKDTIKLGMEEINGNNIIVEDIIKNSLNKLDKDEELPLKLSLRPQKN